MTGGKLDLAFARSFLEKETFDKIIAVDGGLKRDRHRACQEPGPDPFLR